MNRALGHLCAHIGWTGPGKPPEDGEMIEMTLFSRHRIRNLSPGGLRPSTLPLGHWGSPQYWRGWGRNIFVSFKPPRPGTEPRTLAWKAAVLTTTLGPIRNKGMHINFNWYTSMHLYTRECFFLNIRTTIKLILYIIILISTTTRMSLKFTTRFGHVWYKKVHIKSYHLQNKRDVVQ